MVQWVLSSRALPAMLISENFSCALTSLSAMGLIGPGFSRVPSASNCADDPTRVGNVLGKFLQGAIRDRCFCPITGVELTDFVGST